MQEATMKKRGVIVGVECGYTETKSHIVNLDNLGLAEKTETAGHWPDADSSTIAKHINQVITTTCKESGVGFERIVAVVISFPGILRYTGENPVIQSLMKQWSRRKHKPKIIKIINSAELALRSLYRDEPAAVLSGDNESYIVAKDQQGSIFHTGGWGGQVADPGSGAAIRQKVLKYITSVFDHRVPAEPFFDKIAEECSIKSPVDLQNMMRANSLDALQLTQVTFDAARDRDPVAASILSSSALELVDMLRGALTRLPMSKRIPVLVTGRLFDKDTHYLSIIEKKIMATLPHVTIITSEMRPVEYAVQYGIDLTRKR